MLLFRGCFTYYHLLRGVLIFARIYLLGEGYSIAVTYQLGMDINSYFSSNGR